MSTTTVSDNPGRGRGYLWAAIGVCLLGFAAAFVQYSLLKKLIVPWYVPILTTLAVLLLVLSLAQRRSITRVMVFLLFTALAGFEWFALLSLSKLPDYDGPARAGLKFPAFQSALADGRTFSDTELQDGTPRVFVFFRGRW